MAASRMKKSTSKTDVGDLINFQQKLNLASAAVEEMGEEWEEDWGEEWVYQMRARVPYGPGIPIHLTDQIEQVEPGGITMGDAFWWWFLEHGTSNMSPQPFVMPAMKRIRTPSRKDAGHRAIDLIQRGKVTRKGKIKVGG